VDRIRFLITTITAAAFAPKALPPSPKLRRTAVALAEAGRRASPKLVWNNAKRRREAAETAENRDILGELSVFCG
jgi:hypothetical protein